MKEFIQNLYIKYKNEEDIQRLMQSEILNFLKTNAVEIGCNEGYSTYKFCEICKINNKIVTAIDPYNGQQEGNERVFKIFTENILNKYDNIVFLKEESQTENSKNLLKNTIYKYCFVDGLHTKEASYADLTNVYHTIETGGIICLDDTNMHGISEAMNQCVAENKYIIIEKPEPIFYPKHKTFEFLIKK